MKKGTKQKKETKVKAQKADGKDIHAARELIVANKKTLDEIWGVKFSKFGTNDPDEYATKLTAMTRWDLQQECIRMGLYPNERRDIMIERLIKTCRSELALVNTRGKTATPIKASPEVRAILQKQASGGR